MKARFAEPNFIIALALVIALGAVGAVYMMTRAHPNASYTLVHAGPITETVESDGSVTAADSLDLSFQIGGRITYAGPAVGSHVTAGTTLASVSTADLMASLEAAKATLAIQQSKLASLKAGARPEDVAVSEAAVSAAQTSLDQANAGVLAAAQDAYIKSDDAIHNKVDQMFSNPRSDSPQFLLSLSDSQATLDIQSERLGIERLLANWQASLAIASNSDTETTAKTARTNLATIGAYLDLVASGLTHAIPNAAYSTASIQTLEADVALARAAVSADSAALNTADTAEKGAASALATAQSQLALKKAPATAEDITAAEAQVAAAQAQVDAAAAQLAKALIKAPIDGTVTKNDAHTGETAAPGAAVITLNSDKKFRFESYVSEADRGNVAVGQSASVTLDAYRTGSAFAAHVIAVDPAATIENGVPSYKVTLEFDSRDSRIQAGMTGTVAITASHKDAALLVPSSAVITKGSETYVLRKSDGTAALVPVTVGISGGGMTEILSGLSENDDVRSFGDR